MVSNNTISYKKSVPFIFKLFFIIFCIHLVLYAERIQQTALMYLYFLKFKWAFELIEDWLYQPILPSNDLTNCLVQYPALDFADHMG